MKKTKIEKVFLLKVYDENGVLCSNVMPFRTEKGARAAAADLVPADRSFEVIAAELSD